MIQAVFERKPDFRLRDVVIETVIRLLKEEYEQFLSSPCDSYEFIEKNSKSMLMDEKNGVFYCMLVTGEGYRDGVLVEWQSAQWRASAAIVCQPCLLRLLYCIMEGGGHFSLNICSTCFTRYIFWCCTV